ncbi:ABC transporter ATP-binding protein [Oricola indica]|uniref:ABC transporter ATP-binding protein n=1 Tax=Oricola indica TaxID=2872591 RepID=UPI003CCBF187
MSSKPVLSVSDLTVKVGNISIIENVNIDVGEGEIVALVGESGSGKSMTALSVMGLHSGSTRVTGGSITLLGEGIENASPTVMNRLRGTQMAMIFQEPVASLNPLMRIGDQVSESLIIHGKASGKTAWDLAIEMLRDVGIPDPAKRAKQFPFELSGGMCQRVMIASALIAEPKMLIADEPTTALDVTIQIQILQLMRGLRDKTGTSILFITHDLGVVASMADRVCVMYGGRIVETASVKDLFRSPAHPYTRMLLQTIPRLETERKQALYSIPGAVPDIRAWPEGCRFRTRCPIADEQCKTTPELRSPEFAQEGSHLAACWHSGRVSELMK